MIKYNFVNITGKVPEFQSRGGESAGNCRRALQEFFLRFRDELEDTGGTVGQRGGVEFQPVAGAVFRERDPLPSEPVGAEREPVQRWIPV